MTIDWLIQSIIGLAITIPLSALVLMISAKIFKLADTSYKTAIKITAILGAAGFVLEGAVISLAPALIEYLGIAQIILINIALAIYLIKRFYSLDIKKTLLMWLVWFLLSLVVIIVVGTIVGIIIALVAPGVIPQ